MAVALALPFGLLHRAPLARRAKAEERWTPCTGIVLTSA